MNVATRRLPRVLGLFDVSVLAGAAMGPAYSLASTLGPMVAVVGVYALVALGALTAIMLCVAVAFGQMTRFYPSAGSSYAWSALAFGPRVGAYTAWLLLLSNYFATMTTAIPAASYTLDLIAPALASSPLWTAVIAVAWIAASTALLYVGSRPTAVMSAVFLLVELAVLLVAAVVASRVPAPAQPASIHIVPPLGAFATAMVLGIWMIDGWEVSASSSEESSGGARVPGRGGIVALLVTAAVLFAVIGPFLHAGTVAGFVAHQSDAMSYVATSIGGGAWRVVIVATVLLSTAATLWTTVLYLSRSVFSMGRGGVLPQAIGILDARDVPRNALLLVFFCVAVATLATGVWPSVASALNLVLNGTAVFLGMLFLFSCLATIRVLARKPGTPPLATIVAPLLGALALLAIVAIDIVQSDATTRGIEIGGMLLGLPFAWWRGTAKTAEADREAFA
jgi:amino acid transporter